MQFCLRLRWKLKEGEEGEEEDKKDDDDDENKAWSQRHVSSNQCRWSR